MTDKEFCKLHTGFYGEEITDPKQIAMISFDGDELKEYVEHFIPLCEVSRSKRLNTKHDFVDIIKAVRLADSNNENNIYDNTLKLAQDFADTYEIKKR